VIVQEEGRLSREAAWTTKKNIGEEGRSSFSLGREEILRGESRSEESISHKIDGFKKEYLA